MQQPQQGQSGAQGAADDNFDDDDDDGQPFMGQNEPSYAPQPPPQRSRSLICRATRSRFRRAISSSTPPAAQPHSVTRSLRSRQVARSERACRPSSPAAASRSRAANAEPGYGQNGHEQGDRQDRFGHRRRRRHRGGGYRPDRPDNFGNANPQGAPPMPDRRRRAAAAGLSDFPH